MGMFNDNKILTVVRTEQLSETDLKARYNLGYFDSVDVINGITTITRRTRYIDLGQQEYSQDGDYWYLYKLGSGFNSANVKSSLIFKGTNKDNQYDSLYTSGIGYIEVYAPNATQEEDVRGLYNGVMLQYKTNTSYTETVIENQPLNTLDQQGSQWLRQEWEKGLNLFNINNPNLTFTPNLSSVVITKNDENVNITVSNTSISEAYFGIENTGLGNNNEDITIRLEGIQPNKLYLWSSTRGNVGDLYYGCKMKKVENMRVSETYWISTYPSSVNSSYSFKIMINEGDHAYPYQPYKGGIVRESEITDFQNQLNGKQATLVNQQNIKSINGKSLLGSGNYTLEQLGIFTKPVYMNVIQLRDNNGNPVFRMGATSYTNLFSDIEVINKDYAISLIKGETCGFYRNIDDTDLYYGIVPPEFKDLVTPTTNSPDFFEIVYHDLIGVNYNDNAGGQNDFTVCFIDRSTGNITTTIINKDDIGDDQNADYYFEVYSYQVN